MIGVCFPEQKNRISTKSQNTHNTDYIYSSFVIMENFRTKQGTENVDIISISHDRFFLFFITNDLSSVAKLCMGRY